MYMLNKRTREMDIGVKYLPSLIVLLLVLTISITLYLTYNGHHISDSLPYVSDTGTLAPESCIFGQALNILWVLVSATIYVKYRQIKEINSRHNMQNTVLNKRTLIVGLVAAFGMSVVANFQETNMFYVHWVGAILTFGLGSVYLCMQTVLYLNITPIIGQRKVTGLRIILTVVSVLTFFNILRGYLHWKKDDGGYGYHNASVVTEWICATSIITYLSLLYWEFEKINLQEPRVLIEEKNTDPININ
ncbi:hypothetical protein NQ318_018299 [Aromia moschata]|uniref:CWH43-like N-terminal domain-containing protein n=1 Tax=Aromia moschata TaxID=1265417 RepID=A0AAV8ZDM8_9CUCU|nr:hypothetical protein NQ318_018299 [Aromia moschata]